MEIEKDFSVAAGTVRDRPFASIQAVAAASLREIAVELEPSEIATALADGLVLELKARTRREQNVAILHRLAAELIARCAAGGVLAETHDSNR